jgi:hypothetical protein
MLTITLKEKVRQAGPQIEAAEEKIPQPVPGQVRVRRLRSHDQRKGRIPSRPHHVKPSWRWQSFLA